MAQPVVGFYFVVVFLFSCLSPKVSAIQQDVLRLLNMLPALESYERLFLPARSAQEQVMDTTNAVATSPRELIYLKQLSFCYTDNTTTLTGIELNIPVGQSVAIIGPSGAGKSTLADILMGLIYTSHEGVYVDGRQLSKAQLLKWRKYIGYVPHDSHFFHASIRNNLLWSKPDAGEEQLFEALRKANALDVVMSLPQGLETLIGDRGICLSGGERQRLALARALLAAPALLILDEAISALTPKLLWSEDSLMMQTLVAGSPNLNPVSSKSGTHSSCPPQPTEPVNQCV